MSDAVQLAIVTGIVAVATVIIKGIIDAHARKQTAKLEAVEVKIDGRLTQLLEMTQKAYKAEGKEEGKAEEKEKHITVEAQIAPQVIPGGATHLKIVEGEIKVTTETKKPKK